MKIKCVSVRLKSLVQISGKAFRATDFNGNEDIIPISQIFATDYEVSKSETYWISEWILSQKNLTYSLKKVAWFDEKGRMLPTYIVEHHKPEKKEKVDNNIIKELEK